MTLHHDIQLELSVNRSHIIFGVKNSLNIIINSKNTGTLLKEV